MMLYMTKGNLEYIGEQSIRMEQMTLKFVFKHVERWSIFYILGKGIPDQRSLVHSGVSKESNAMCWKAELLSLPCGIQMSGK